MLRAKMIHSLAQTAFVACSTPPTQPQARQDAPLPESPAIAPGPPRGRQDARCSRGLPLIKKLKASSRQVLLPEASSKCERPPILKEEGHYVRTMAEVSAGVSNRHSTLVAHPPRGVSLEDHPKAFRPKAENPCAVEVTSVPPSLDSYWKSR
jgi:hypothetical protein